MKKLAICCLFLCLSCGSRNIYQNVRFPATPLERKFIYMTREKNPDAGVEPVDFGGVLATKDVIYIASEAKGVEAFERTLFLKRWNFPVKNGVSSSFLLQNHILYFGANDGTFYALNAEDGKVLWKYETKAPVFSIANIFNKKIYITASDNVIYCLDQMTGKWIWHYKRGMKSTTTIHGNSTVAISTNAQGLPYAYVGFSDGYLVALNALDGNLQWETKIHSGIKFTDVNAMPVLEEDRIYIPSYDGSLYAVEKNHGKVLWHIDVGGAKKVVLDGKILYLAASDGHVYCINKESGHILWKFELDLGTPTELILHGNLLVFGSSREYFYAIHKGDGSIAYRENIGLRSGFVGNPYESENEVLILSNFGNLYVYRFSSTDYHPTSQRM